MLLQWVEIQLLATVGWKCGFQPFSCPCSTYLPFVKSKSPLPTRSFRCLRAAAHSTSSALWLRHAHPSVAAAEKTCLMQRSRGFGHGVVVLRTCWGIFRSPMVPCDDLTTTKHWMVLEIENFTTMGGGLPAFQLPLFAKCDYCRCQEYILFLFACLDLEIWTVTPHQWLDVPESWYSKFFHRLCIIETALQRKSCSLHYCHHVPFAPIVFSQQQVGFDRQLKDLTAVQVPCDSAFICWRSIAVVPSKIQNFAEFGGGISSPPKNQHGTFISL